MYHLKSKLKFQQRAAYKFFPVVGIPWMSVNKHPLSLYKHAFTYSRTVTLLSVHIIGRSDTFMRSSLMLYHKGTACGAQFKKSESVGK